jgi:hypothetical protein
MDNLHTVITRDQAIAQFKECVLPSVRKQECENESDFDEVMRSEAWSHFTDSLCKDGQISDWQYMNWSTPQCCER